MWPSRKRVGAIARTWVSTTHATECAILCAGGLTPKTEDGFTVFWNAKGATSLTCTEADAPGCALIRADSLVLVAIACMWMSMDPIAMVSFCRREKTQHQSAFWDAVGSTLSFVVSPAASMCDAALLHNPWQKEFVLASSHRLHSRAPSSAIDSFVSAAISSAWVSTRNCVWPASVSRWISEYNIAFEVCRLQDPTSFVVYGVRVHVSNRDAVFLLLMCLFAAGPLQWGERRPLAKELPPTLALLFDRSPFLHTPPSSPMHETLSKIRPR